MTKRASTACVFALAFLMLGAACGGNDDGASDAVQVDADTVQTDAGDDSAGDDEATPDAESSDGETVAGFGELVEGEFVLTGAADERFDVGDDQLAFRTGGGCDGSGFGFSMHVNDAAGEITYATFEAQGPEDLSGGVTGEFDAVDFEANLFPGGDLSLAETVSGPVKMLISEHDTGGASADLNARRMTVSLLGSVPSDAGDVDVDITFRWVMGCP